MSGTSERQRHGEREASVICMTCGGRGALRQGDESYRTCLDCLGQGRLPGMAAATTTAAVLNQGAVLMQPCASESITDGATSAAR